MPTYLLDEDLCFLNHGSFGATPRELLERQDALRRQMERRPIDFLARGLDARLREARDAVAAFLGAEPAGMVFVHNATAGVNAVLRSLEFSEGDEILTTNHRYDAVANTLGHMARRHGARVVEAEVPYPLQDHGQVVDAVERAITARTRLLVVDHITSPTALVFPVEELVALARTRGIPILVDGAHAPGQVHVGLSDLQPDFWVGNLHKWLCAPKGAAVLYVGERWRDAIHPVVTSHGHQGDLAARFHWCGTFDPTPWLTAPDAIALHEAQGGASFRAAHHALVRSGRIVVASAVGTELPHPDDPTLYGSMATIRLPVPVSQCESLFRAIREEDHIEVPILTWRGRVWVRISGFSGYNKPEQYERLADALARRCG